MIAQEIYDCRDQLMKQFPTLDIRVVRSGSRHRHYVVGARPQGSEDIHVWLWTPMENFPDDELQLKLSLIA